MRQETATVKYRKDYKAPDFLIDTVDLQFELADDHTIVSAKLEMMRNKNSNANSLVLDGEDLELLEVKLNDQVLSESDYQITAESLTIHNVPEKFCLETKVRIKPQENKKLMGLYLSNGIYCTQCESEGFRRITYFLDRSDVLATYTTKIIADKQRYPVLLANGNKIDSGVSEDGRHFATWHDPFKKPCYLFATVAGDLGVLEDHFETLSGRKVTLQIFAAHDKIEHCHFAMQSLKKAMRWDEETYGREYDLDIFMIVAVNDFNAGAMENKGLNIFNDRYILASPDTATDFDYGYIDRVVSHEYFHNWSGDRVTVRDWFQLSLKEGFTVFRDHSFSEDIGLQEVERILQVQRLRSMQFPEDAGPLAHPIRPDSYIEMGNFYTSTVYEKGSEVIRMMKTILGAKQYRQGTDLYFDRHDGCAVTCEDFVKAMEDASGVDLQQFRLWYSQAGTPVITVKSHYDEALQQLTLTVSQHLAPTPGQPTKEPMHIPLLIALFDESGKTLLPEQVLHLRQAEQEFVFDDIATKAVPSLLRGFSAPVKLHYDYSDAELALLMQCDDDGFARWEAGQQYACRVLLNAMHQYQQGEELTVAPEFIKAMTTVLHDQQTNKALIAQMLQLPAEDYLAGLVDVVDVKAINAAKKFVTKAVATALQQSLMTTYQQLQTEDVYHYDVSQVAARSLKNKCLHYLAALEIDETIALCEQQFQQANNMTDQMAALTCLASIDSKARTDALDAFYQRWQDDTLVVDKWFTVQAMADHSDVLAQVKQLLEHPDFNITNPNKVRALIGSFSRGNPAHFHTEAGYQLLADYIIKLDKINPMVASRISEPFTQWRRFDEATQQLMRQHLETILAVKDLSKDVYEIASKALA